MLSGPFQEAGKEGFFRPSDNGHDQNCTSAESCDALSFVDIIQEPRRSITSVPGTGELDPTSGHHRKRNSGICN